jgi:catechol 2,3-dioxygenase-like lactoylglutathione lyase family enzyme
MKTKKAAPAAEKEVPDNRPLDSIDHIAIPVMAGEVEATVDFYLKKFGCSVIYRDHSWAFLRFGNIKLAFVVPDEHPPHLAFISPQAEEFGELKTHRDGTRSVYVRDPSANTIEIMAPPETQGQN